MNDTVNIRELNEIIATKSNFVNTITQGMNQTIVGQKHLIDSLLIHTQDGTEFAGNRKQGNKAIERYKKLEEPDDCTLLSTRVLCFISSTAALSAFFDETPNFQNTNPVLNRHLACHGMLQRDVNDIDCIQLILLYWNMLHCVGEI